MTGMIPNDEPCFVCGARRGEDHGEYQDPNGEWLPCEGKDYEEEDDGNN